MAQVHALARYRFDAAQQGDLSFEVGEHILVLEQGNTGWWLGQTDDGRQGIFPYNRVEISAAPALPTRPAPATGGTGIPEALMILDRINGLTVKAETPIPRYDQKFVVRVQTSAGVDVEASKTMKDFRIFNQALNSITGTSSGIIAYDKAELVNTEIPQWADNIKLPANIASNKTKQRADILRSYLNDARDGGIVDYLIFYFVDPNAKFSCRENDRNDVKEAWRAARETITRQPPPQDPVMARALYKWTKRDDQDISFMKGEILAMEENSEYEGWWMGTKVNGDKGLFPYNYVEKLNSTGAGEILHPDLYTQASVAPSVPTMNPIMGAFVPPGLGNDGPSFNDNPGQYQNTVSQVFTQPGKDMTPRTRAKITKYSLCSTEAFDELLRVGVTIEENGRLARLDQGRDTPKKGDTVTLFYSGFIWEPQKQELLEFSSSDALISNNNPNNVPGPLVFTLGSDQAIDGIEEAVGKMALGQSVRVTLTPEKAYQEVGLPPDIPGNAYLVYDLTLKNIKRGANAGVLNTGGAGRSNVVQRPRQGGNGGFMGGNSMRDVRPNANARQPNFMGHNAPQGVGPEHFKKQLTLAKLQEIVRKKNYFEFGINPALIEEYLTPEEFQLAFRMDPSRWLLLPAFQRKKEKERVGLF